MDDLVEHLRSTMSNTGSSRQTVQISVRHAGCHSTDKDMRHADDRKVFNITSFFTESFVASSVIHNTLLGQLDILNQEHP
jgi:Fe-S cluster assembly iron-binding protein IscA